MGALVDHVPNHVAVGRPELNPRWWAMLRDGPGSDAGALVRRRLGRRRRQGHPAGARRAARRRRRAARGRRRRAAPRPAALPAGAGHRVAAAGRGARPPALPRCSGGATRPATSAASSPSTASSPCASRTPRSPRPSTPCPACSPTTPAFAGVRVDHVDGLADPLAYLDGLRDAIGDRWLRRREDPRRRRDAAARLAGRRHDRLRARRRPRARPARPRRVGPAARRWVRVDRRRPPVPGVGARRPPGGPRGRAAAGPRARRRGPRRPPSTRRSTPTCSRPSRLSVHLERYRTYLPDDEGRPALAAAVAAAPSRPPRPGGVDRARWPPRSTSRGEWRDRWQQLTGPATAKGVEDRAFWRYVPLASLGEVGGRAEPDAGADAVAALHAHHADTRGSLAGDAARRHDPRRRRAARTCGPPAWRSPPRPTRWARRRRVAGGPGAALDVDPAMQWLALQTVAHDARPRRRAAARRSSSRRRGRPTSHTSWTEPDERYEAALAALAAACSSWPPARELAAALRPPGPGHRLAHARRAPDGARRRRRLPGHRGVPRPARRPRQPRRAGPRRARRARRAGRDARRPGGVGRARRRPRHGRSRSPAAAAAPPPADGYARCPHAGRRCSPSPALDAAGDAALVTVVPPRGRPAARRSSTCRPAVAPRARRRRARRRRARSPSTPAARRVPRHRPRR